jgi:hypothetical protein
MIPETKVYEIQDTDSLLTFLREELNWQLPEADIGDLTFEWTGTELNLSEDVQKKLKDGVIHQLQPFRIDQPWGVFVVDFAIPMVSVLTLRKILRRLVSKRRLQRPDMPSWKCENLLFICLYGEDGFTFAHFRGDDPYSSRLTTFSWRPGDPVRTICEYNLPALEYDDRWDAEAWVAEWQKAFDVERVNKLFYRQIAQLYYRLIGKEGHKPELVLPSVGDDTRHVGFYEEFSVRLIGRTIFCWFLKHKKSDNGVSLMPAEILSLAAVQKTADYYHTVLEPLFFEVMNKRVKDRKPLTIPQSEMIPFLNGGLFESHPSDFYWDMSNYGLKIPDGWFQDFFGLLEQYNFTIRENSSIDVDVAVDPEMLGRIFENLLAEVVPETGETARKVTGSYYTPRVIVDYMVEQSLKQYLLAKTALPEDKLNSLLSYENDPIVLSDGEKNAVVTALKEIKVIDPACGSGAFPMGILHRMLITLEKVDPRLEIWRRLYLSTYHPVMRRIIEDKLRKGNEQYIRKLTVIQDSIYGVDIQPIAVEIAKLRCFLSLVVDEIVLDNEENRGIEPLPNLEFKFVAANTLIGLPSVASQSAFGVTVVVEKLKELRETYLRSFGADKVQIEKEFKATQRKLFKENVEWAVSDTLVKQLTEWDPFSYESCSWFEPEWMFGISNGFDVVIGNPPYLESRSPNFPDGVKDNLQRATKIRWGPLAQYITRGADLLVYFLEVSLFIIQESGTVVLLTHNSWLDTLYGKRIQEFLMLKTNVKKIIDSDYKYFDSKGGPNINTVISIFTGRKPDKDNRIAFVRFHESFDRIPFAVSDLETMKKRNLVDYSMYKYSDKLVQETKWGILISSGQCVLDMLEILKLKGEHLHNIRGRRLFIGQGLNLTKDYIIDESTIEKFPFLNAAKIPFMTSDDGTPFELNSTNKYLADGLKLNQKQLHILRSEGIRVFDSSLTSKTKPVLILPRGVSKHFCAMNKADAYSASFVDIYVEGELDSSSVNKVLYLWLFLNSSIAWLLREISGRKNLGGGLLKAEAADLDQFPIYLDFGNSAQILDVYHIIRKRHALDTIEEINTQEHNMIDDIVFGYLKAPDVLRSDIMDTLKKRLSERFSKSVT